ncbi:MAG: response regulator [Magnetococcales bacterium]|nr:response regulator [Magnetococcales bacterium]
MSIKVPSSESHPHLQSGSERRKQGPPFAGVRVLVVEDIAINQQVAREILQREGCVVTLVGEGQGALELVAQQPFDLVFMDLHMPGWDGMETTRQIRKIPGLEGLPVVAMTAHAFEHDRQQCLESGMNDHLTKPINFDTLRQVLHRWLPAWKPAQAPTVVPGEHETGDSLHVVPNLPGFDLSVGLSNVVGNRLLYRILLRKFFRITLDTSARLQQALAEKEYGQAKVLVHGLVGAGGNLGALSLTRAARDLEQELTGGAISTDEMLQQKWTTLQHCMEEVLTALNQWGGAGHGAQQVDLSQFMDQEKRALLYQLLEKLHAMAASKDVVEGMRWVEQLESQLAGCQLVTEAELLVEQFFGCDFVQAQQTITRIQNTLAANV